MRRFRDWPKGLLPGAVELVRALAGGVAPACLSNTNELHWNERQDAEVVRDLFDPGSCPKLVDELALEPGERLRVPVDELGWTGRVRHVRKRILSGHVRDAKPDDDRNKRHTSHEGTSSSLESTTV